MIKYPRTRHLAGSRRQPGDEGTGDADWSELTGRHVVVEEKVDGANAGISFGPGGELRLQSRGHYLTGGSREKHWDLFKQFANTRAVELFEALGERHVMYGEWLYAKHTVYYDALPHYFLEYDVLDRESGAFLSTDKRRELLAGAGLESVPVLFEGPARTDPAKLRRELTALVGPSRYQSPAWRESLAAEAVRRGLDPWRVLAETDGSGLMEGLYVKVEEGGKVLGRYKWVRADFLQTILDSGEHWLRRPLVSNATVGGGGGGV